MAILEIFQPEYFPLFVKDFRNTLTDMGPIYSSGSINYIRSLIYREDLRLFDYLSNENGANKNIHLEQNLQGLGKIFPYNELSKQKRAMRHSMWKLCQHNIRGFEVRFTYLNKYFSSSWYQTQKNMEE